MPNRRDRDRDLRNRLTSTYSFGFRKRHWSTRKENKVFIVKSAKTLFVTNIHNVYLMKYISKNEESL